MEDRSECLFETKCVVFYMLLKKLNNKDYTIYKLFTKSIEKKKIFW